MQDKDNIANIDKQFTDLGWEKMRGVLNEEMPVVPVRKRRWTWLWLLLFLGIMASGTYYNFAIKNTTQPNEIPNTAIADVIENTNDNDKFGENDEATQNSNEKTTEKITNTSEVPLIADIQPREKAIIPPKITLKKEIEKNINENNLHIIKENNFNKKDIDENVFFVENKVENSSEYPRTDDFSRRHLTAKVVSTELANTPVTSEKEPTKSAVTSTAAPIKNQIRSSLVTTKRVASLSPRILSSNNLVTKQLAAFDPIPKPRKFSQTYSVFAGARSDKFTDFGGINAGLLAHYRFTPKAGLETGLTYNNLRKNINTNVDYTDSINVISFDNTKPFITMTTDALNLHYLRLPLSFTYRPHTKIQLATGLNVGYRFRINGASNNSNEYFTADNNGIVILDDIYSSSVEVDTESVGAEISPMDMGERIDVPYSFSIRKVDLAAHAGLRYYPVPRLGIDLSYQHGLLNMTKNTTPNRNSGLQLALVYQLHR